MSLQRVFLLAFILAFAAAALLAIGVILLGNWNELEYRLLWTTVSIGVYSLIALGCATVYADAHRRAVAIAGFVACALGLTYALLANWGVIKRTSPDSLINGRLAFLAVAMALAATALMLGIEATSAAVRFSRGATIFLIWLTTILFEYINFFVFGTYGGHDAIFKLIAACSILALLGLLATPILRRIYA
jgi:hypothetical protein